MHRLRIHGLAFGGIDDIVSFCFIWNTNATRLLGQRMGNQVVDDFTGKHLSGGMHFFTRDRSEFTEVGDKLDVYGIWLTSVRHWQGKPLNLGEVEDRPTGEFLCSVDL